MSNNYNATLQTNNSSLEEIIEQLNAMPDAGSGGIDTSDATALASDILNNKTAYVDGEKITGTIPTKTSSDLTASGNTVTVPSGYYASQTTKSVSTATQATPSITVNSSGLITASTTQSAGYVVAGTKSATKQLTTQAAKTVTPGTTNQTAVASGRYTTGTITVKGDSNLIASNIKSGTSIFGVTGTYVGTGSSGGSSSDESKVIEGLLNRNISKCSNDNITRLGTGAFAYCTSLTQIDLPVCISVGASAFSGCYNLTSVNMPICASVASCGFAYCSKLTAADFPSCTYIGPSAFIYCSSLSTINFPICTTVSSQAFQNCSKLTSVNLPLCKSIGVSAFAYCLGLISINLPACTYLSSNAFRNCYKLTSIDFSECIYINSYAFSSCSSLATINFPKCQTIGSSAFDNCYNLASASFPVCKTINNYAFAKCSKLSKLVLNYSSLVALKNINAFANTPMSNSSYIGSFGSIYVPSSLVASYKAATNWTTYAARITAIT